MTISLRGIVAALVLAGTLVVLLTVTAHAQSWSSAVTAGLTSVESEFEDGQYTWTLHNYSSLPGDPDSEYDVLVWALIPFRVRQPLSWSAPEGWTWSGSRFELEDPSRKYCAPNAIGPGRRAAFSYRPDPLGLFVNDKGRQPAGLAFITHVAAVVPRSGAVDGTHSWTPGVTQYGGTWFDQSASGYTVPELRGLLVLAFGVAGAALSAGMRPKGRA